MLKFLALTFSFVSLLTFYGCKNSEGINMNNQVNIIFLHHSTGNNIWNGGISKIGKKLGFDGDVLNWFDDYNKQNNTNYKIIETNFPEKTPYGWNNYPYDYYNIWVKNAGDQPFKEEPTLEILTKKYNVIIFKHCFPVSSIKPDSTNPDINSEEKTLANYKLQYSALKKKLLEFPDTKFILWTPTALVESKTTKEEAERANEFSEWVKTVWDIKGDNIFLWDFRQLQVEDGLYFQNKYAVSDNDSHPNSKFSGTVALNLCRRIVDVIEGRADSGNLTGKKLL
jgi:hypothetical protein